MWWEYVIIAGVLLFGIYGFLVLVRVQTRSLTRRTSRTAESMYRIYGDSRHKRRHGGDPADGESS